MSNAGFEQYRSELILLAEALIARQRKGNLEASDLVQDSLLEAHRNGDQYRGTTEDEKRAWLRRILKNNFLDACAKDRAGIRDIKRKALEADLTASFAGLDALLVGSHTSPSQQAIRNEELAQLAHALDQLPKPQREAIMCKDIAGRSLKETGDELEMTPTAVAGLLYRGRQRLMELMDDERSEH